jgi:hypothetical protein
LQNNFKNKLIKKSKVDDPARAGPACCDPLAFNQAQVGKLKSVERLVGKVFRPEMNTFLIARPMKRHA